jgi:WD40 repeat protein
LSTFHISEQQIVLCLIVLRNGTLASGNWNSTITIFSLDIDNVKNNKLLKTLRGHEDLVSCLKELPDRNLASGSQDNTIKLWDLQSGKLMRTLRSHKGLIRALEVFSEGFLVSGSQDRTIKIWNTNSGSLVKTLKTDFLLKRDEFSEIKKMSDESVVYGTFRKYPFEVNGIYEFPSPMIMVSDVHLAIRFCDKLAILDVQKCEIVREIWGDFFRLVVVGATRKFLVLSQNSNIIVVNLSENWEFMGLLKGHRSFIWSMVALSDGNLASGSFDGEIRVWEVTSGQLLKSIRAFEYRSVDVLVQSIDGRFLICSSWSNRNLQVWKLESTNKNRYRRQVFKYKQNLNFISNKMIV